jgi:hypothetical protein
MLPVDWSHQSTKSQAGEPVSQAPARANTDWTDPIAVRRPPGVVQPLMNSPRIARDPTHVRARLQPRYACQSALSESEAALTHDIARPAIEPRREPRCRSSHAGNRCERQYAAHQSGGDHSLWVPNTSSAWRTECASAQRRHGAHRVTHS